MMENTGTLALCLSTGRRLEQPPPDTSFLKVLLGCQVSPPFPQGSLWPVGRQDFWKFPKEL